MSALSAKGTEIRPASFGAAAMLETIHTEASNLNLTPGWLPRTKPIIWPQPRPEFVPAHWSYEAARAMLDVAGPLIDLSLAERRVLVLRNPAPSTDFETARTLACAYQMILPGEIAPSHRHSPHALRVIIDGEGSYSIVDGERIPMETGDVVLTPGWCWHGHGHDGDRPAYWFDGLDVPLTHLLEPMFYEEHPKKYQPLERVVASSPFRHTRDATARRLDAAIPDTEGFHGRRVVLAAPDMPSMGLHLERWARRRADIDRPQTPSSWFLRGAARQMLANTSSVGAKATRLSLPPGPPSSTASKATRCCSLFPTNR